MDITMDKKITRRQTMIYTRYTENCTTRTPLKIGDELRCSERVSRSCSPSGICRVFLVTNHKVWAVHHSTGPEITIKLKFWVTLLGAPESNVHFKLKGRVDSCKGNMTTFIISWSQRLNILTWGSDTIIWKWRHLL